MIPAEVFLTFILMLTIFLGFELIHKVPATLHTPLMSGSNAISGITLVGAVSLAGTGQLDLAIRDYHSALESLAAHDGGDTSQIATVRENLGIAMATAGVSVENVASVAKSPSKAAETASPDSSPSAMADTGNSGLALAEQPPASPAR